MCAGRRGVFFALLGLTVLVSLFWVTRIAASKEYRFATVDIYTLYFPAYDLAARWLVRGVLPLWNPYALCGIPWVAALQEGFFYPPHLLYLLLPAPTAFAASTLLHLVFLAVSTALFARRAGLGVAAAALAGLLVVVRGTTPEVAVMAPCQFEALVWLPLGATAVLDLAHGGGRRPVALLALSTALSILAGYPQSTAYVVYTWAALFVVLVLGSRRGLRRGLVATGLFVGGLALGTLGGAIQLLPALELVTLGTRSSEPLLPLTMFPLGNPARQFLREAISGSRLSFGVVGLALAVAAPFAAQRRALTLWALGWGALTLTFALGPLTPLFQLYLALPPLASFRAPHRILSVTDFAFAIAAAIGLDAVLAATRNASDGTPGGSGVRWRPVLAAVVGLAAASSFVIVGISSPPRNWGPALLAGGGMTALMALVLLRGAGRLAFAGALIALAVAEVFMTPAFDGRLPYTAAATQVYRQHEAAFAALAKLAGYDRVWIFNRQCSPALAQKLAGFHQLRSFDDYEPVNPLRQAQYFTYLIDATPTVSRWPWLFAGNLVTLKPIPGAPEPAARRRLLDLAAVRFVVFTSADLSLPEVRDFVAGAGLRRLPPLPGETPTLNGPELVLFENPHVLPRAYVVYRTRPAPPVAELLGRISQDDFDPLLETYVDGDLDRAAAPEAVPRGTPAVITRDEERSVEIVATLAAPGLLVLADSFYPGWKATVKGVPVPILPTNHLFRGVALPAGVHVVRFEYQPWSFTFGASASLATLAVLILLWWRGRAVSGPGVAAT